MTNSEFQKKLYSAFQQLNFNDEYKFIYKLKKGGQIKDSNENIEIKDKNKGKFTASAGQSVQKHAKSVLNNLDSRKQKKYFEGGPLEIEEEPREETQTWKAPFYNNSYRYIISKPYQKQIRFWEGTQMQFNDSFPNQSRKALSMIDKKSLQRLSPAQLDSLISYCYHVAGRYHDVVAPIVRRLGKAQSQEEFNQIITQIHDAMPAQHNPAKGTINRINVERLPFVVNTNVQEPVEVKPEPQPTVLSILSKQMTPIVELPNVTLVARPAPSIKLVK